jgi:uncharacterized membrane protein
VADLVRIPAAKFGVLSLIGTVIYATVLSVIGYELGHAWGSINHGLTVATYILVALVVIAIAGFVFFRLRQFRREARAANQTPAPTSSAAGSAVQTPAAAPRRPGGRHRSDAEV